MNFNQKDLVIKDIDLSSLQSFVIIVSALAYHCTNNLHWQQNSYQFSSIILACVGGVLLFAYFTKAKMPKLGVWYLLGAVSIMAFIFNYEATVNAQMLEGLRDSVNEVGTASGGSFASDVIDAIIELVLIAIYIVVGAAVIAAIAFGVTQGQWQAPLLVIGTVSGIGLFLEIMGKVVFG